MVPPHCTASVPIGIFRHEENVVARFPAVVIRSLISSPRLDFNIHSVSRLNGIGCDVTDWFDRSSKCILVRPSAFGRSTPDELPAVADRVTAPTGSRGQCLHSLRFYNRCSEVDSKQRPYDGAPPSISQPPPSARNRAT
jgi:hypothetical protein